MLFASNAPDLLALIPLSARTVLEVGCGSGGLGAAYRAMNPRARLLGIETDPILAAQAESHLEQVATVDPERDALPFDLPDGVDCIIYNEALERLRDPWAMIRRHAAVLRADAVVLIRVRNPDHWRVAERLLRGRPGDDEGRDSTTMPGFDRNAIGHHLIGAGLTLCDITTPQPDGDAARFATAITPGLEALGVDPREYASRAGPSHLIVRAAKELPRRMTLAGNMLDPVGAVSHVRVVYPIHAMATDPTVEARVTDQVRVAAPGDTTPRIFVLHRPAMMGEQGRAVLRNLIEAGFLIVTEFDDLPEHFAMMRHGGALGFYGVHAVQTTTATMAEALRAYHSEIAVFPNAVGSLAPIGNFTDPGVVTMFFGALNRELDWLPLMPVINAVAAVAGDRLRFQVVHDQSFFEALETPYKTFTRTCDHETYLRLLSRCEISFMPLVDNRFNRAKSDLKFIEAGSCRVAALASSVVYGDSIEDGRTGLLFRDPSEFNAKLLRLLAMPELAREIGDAARRYVSDERMLAYQVAPRIAWYRSLWARREMLGEARRQRMMRNQAA
ncbi:methyltransferase [Rhodopila sp.]|uniref:methyltransferase n=1 Tax=Rhodopila sp. TaxID=2480087 RepID=UPI003D13E424